jgi:hypothetical protein
VAQCKLLVVCCRTVRIWELAIGYLKYWVITPPEGNWAFIVRSYQISSIEVGVRQEKG